MSKKKAAKKVILGYEEELDAALSEQEVAE